MNELLLLLEIVIVFSMLLISKKIFGKTGLYLWIGLASVIANIQVVKSINLFGISATLGNVMFASNFLATDILSECYGKQEAKKGVYIGIFSIIIYLISTQIMLTFRPNEIDIAENAMRTLFNLAPRVCISSLIMYSFANIADVFLYNKLKQKMSNKNMWIRNNVSTIICNCLENFGFTFLAFAGVYTVKDMLIIACSTSIIEILIAICDTPFLYLAKKQNNNTVL